MRRLKRTEAITLGRTMFTGSVLDLESYNGHLLKRVTDRSNHKMGGGGLKVWRAGAHKGLPLYSLALEERATCPTGCAAWAICYGNHSPFIQRVSPAANERLFIERLIAELDKLDADWPGGYSIRLHVLGDFYSLGYVRFWGSQLAVRAGLHIYGYSHQSSEIGLALDELWSLYGARFNILASDTMEGPRPKAIREDMLGAESLVVCPEQTGRVKGCLDCGLCTNEGIKGVQFLNH